MAKQINTLSQVVCDTGDIVCNAWSIMFQPAIFYLSLYVVLVSAHLFIAYCYVQERHWWRGSAYGMICGAYMGFFTITLSG